MSAKSINRLLVLVVVSLFYTGALFAQQPTPRSSGYATSNGQKVYYEIYGEGKPIVLLHGAYMTIGMNWGPLIPELAKTRKVIALEMQGHGHTPWTSRPLSWDALAEDVINTLQFLKIENADLIGYSFGGTLAYNVAIKYPKAVNKIVIISSTYKSDGWQKEARDILQSMKPEFLSNSPLQTEYVKVAPDSTQWIPFLTGMMAYAKADFNLGDDKIKNIKSPVLIISGDNDGIDKNVLIQTYKSLGGAVFGDMAGIPKSRLAIVPGQGHVSVMMQTETILRYLNEFL